MKNNEYIIDYETQKELNCQPQQPEETYPGIIPVTLVYFLMYFTGYIGHGLDDHMASATYFLALGYAFYYLTRKVFPGIVSKFGIAVGLMTVVNAISLLIFPSWAVLIFWICVVIFRLYHKK